ncbi:hypothetical protein ACFY0G_02245 [Streptomyces sp. NPDC001552]|uniref:hypothetical protein n=1 Tax=Streptomyces sp. NPDC001552 TaxID=3364587 RepID=UPI00369E1B1D
MNREELTAELLAALKPCTGPELAHVELETADGGTELLLYGEGPEFQDGGVLLIPPGLDFPAA